MRRKQQVILIITVITTTLKYTHAVDEARTMEPPHDDASPRVEPPKPGPQDGGGPVDA